MAKGSVRLHRLDLNKGTFTETDDVVASDKAICVFINDEYYRTLIATPTMVEELVIGHLLGEGIVTSIDVVKRIEVEPLRVNVELQGETDLDLVNRSKINLITTACGSITTPLTGDQLDPLKIEPDIEVEAERIWGMIRELNKRSMVYQETGGTHSALICKTDGGVVSFAEDVGRHNAVDKAIGACALARADFNKCVLVSSGRQSGEMVLKAARSGIPIIASVAAPLESGITLSKAAGITLICFVRGQRMNIYSHPRRVSLKGRTPDVEC
jgi:formate dehydrogenase accessory protein FdhD